MTNPASFESQLRRRKIAPPTARDFDETLWQAALKTTHDSSEAELIRTGLWFGNELQARWARLEALGLAGTSIGVLSRHVAGVANLMHLRTGAMLHAASLATERAALPMGSLAQIKLNADGRDATADMIRTSGIDTLGKFAGYVRTTVAARRGNARLNETSLQEAYPLFEDIYLLDYLWGRIALCGWRMIEVGRQIQFMRPKPDPMGVSFVVAEFRRERLLDEFHRVFGMEWRQVQSVLPPAWQVRVRKRDNGYSFNALRRPAGQGNLPVTYALREVLKSTELAPYHDDPLPLLGEPAISLDDLLTAWELLALAADGLSDLLYGKNPSAGPLTFAPSIRLVDLYQLLEPLKWTLPKRQAVIGFFVYEGHAVDGLWSKPLLPIGGGRVVPVLTPLSCPNLLRTAELWISEGAGEAFFTKRGNEAEVKLRADIAAALAGRPWRQTAMVLESEWVPKINGVRRDIDLVVRIGTTVFIGELKLKKYPVSAAEVGRHTDEFNHAAEQLNINEQYADIM